MREMIEVQGQGIHARLAAHPVTCGEYRAYLRAVGKPVPPRLAVQAAAAREPVTFVSQADALAACAWLGAQEGCAYRLPGLAELAELASEAALDGISPEIWPHHHGARPEVRGGMKEIYLCEWTQETETIALPGGRVRVLGSVFYPPWLREGPNATHLQAHLLASEGYSFVTFRVACDA